MDNINHLQNEDFYFNTGYFFHKQKKYSDAENYYLKSLEINHQYVPSLINLAGLYQQQLKFDDAIKFYLKSLELEPGNTSAYNNLATIYLKNKNIVLAIHYYLKLLEFEQDFRLYNHVANLFLENREFEKALKYYSEAINLNPSCVFSFIQIATILKNLDRLQEAEPYLLQAITLKPDNADYIYDLGVIFLEQEKYEQAESYFLKALEIDSNNAKFINNLGIVLHEKNELEQALEYYQKAISLEPGKAEFYSNLGVLFDDLGRHQKAMQNYLYSLKLDPDYPDAHYNLSNSLLLFGDYKKGWAEYEWRFFVNKNDTKILNKFYWNGSDLEDKTIYVFAEQGFGDTIQFCRYLSLIKKESVKIIFGCQKELVSLLQELDSISSIVDDTENTEITYDYHIPLLSLPGIIKTTIDTIPANIPYIKVNDTSQTKWANKFKGNEKFKIGIAWSPKSDSKTCKNRSVPLKYFIELANNPEIELFSLQKEISEALPENIKNYSKEIEDFSDTAAIINNMDLIISVDTSAAHLAGAMGKPVWTIIPFSPDWRWLLNRKDSPWYSTMRLFRQSVRNNWDDVFDNILLELKVTLGNQ